MDGQLRRLAIGRRRDHDLLDQLSQEVKMTLDVVMFACTGAGHRRQCTDRRRKHRWIDRKGLGRTGPLLLLGSKRSFDLVTLTLKVIKHLVERFDLRLAVEDTIGDLSCDGFLLSRHVVELAL
ncbi:MAG: hypothetical protein ACK43M_22095 [Allorhizobium sp.]